MDDNGYRVVFDVATAGFKSWSFSAFGLIFVFLGVVVIPILQRFSARNAGRGPLFQVLFVGFAALWTITSFASTYRDYSHARETLANGQTQMVEGNIENFIPNYKKESFSVSGVPFSYSDYVITAGFNHTESHGGPVHANEHVRIWYLPTQFGNEILRLAIKE